VWRWFNNPWGKFPGWAAVACNIYYFRHVSPEADATLKEAQAKGDLEWRKIDAAIEMQRLVGAEQLQPRGRMVRLMRALFGVDRGARDRLYVYHLEPDLLRRLKNHRKTGHKKPA